ncbi:hypothetical protein [Pontibacter akesuensis]|uniref:Uncharacterized protein n=1 Tax=Pontibacter akesuensis TaxID=388950 RepID=A0A1I7IEH8_9BACT|nr:hypothetical protein [Pontibacter akesuensis]GHA66795.1 hypothetical protein GCM10007389_19840 [Pontibacter akesuensis]SFU71339.1 hypothetical protein SAMN04487941_2152 [Pontibacter akesuensis]
MANNEINSNSENHDIGRSLYQKDQQHNRNSNSRGGYANDHDRRWSEGNFFHTGPSPRGAQDRDNDNYNRGGASNSSYNQGQNAHLSDHYGSRSDSAYRNERAYINHGDRGNSQYQHDQSHSMRRPHTPGGALERKNSEYENEPWREGPFTGSRYKEDDSRYGSGSHNWYRENRYTHDDDDDNRRYGNRQQHDERGFMDRVKDTWNDIWHSDDRDYHSRNRNASYNNDSNRRDYESYRNRNFDRGLEGGPRWADESDSGHDNQYDNINRNQRYRR